MNDHWQRGLRIFWQNCQDLKRENRFEKQVIFSRTMPQAIFVSYILSSYLERAFIKLSMQYLCSISQETPFLGFSQSSKAVLDDSCLKDTDRDRVLYESFSVWHKVSYIGKHSINVSEVYFLNITYLFVAKFLIRTFRPPSRSIVSRSDLNRNREKCTEKNHSENEFEVMNTKP